MNDLTIRLIREKMARNTLSMRGASLQIGVSHTTMQRTLNGEPYDVPTAEKIAKWLHVPVSTLLDLSGDGQDALAKQIAVILVQEPKLAEIFAEAVGRVIKGKMSLETFRALASYAAFQLQLTEKGEVSQSNAETGQSQIDVRVPETTS